MTIPSEYDLIAMEKRARWLLDSIAGKRDEVDRLFDLGTLSEAKTWAEEDRVDREEQLARDLLALVQAIRAVGGRVLSART